MTKAYYPEPYVLPPCFVVSRHPPYGRKYYSHTRTNFRPAVTQYQEIQFPKNELSDRIFGVIPPEHFSDLAYTLARNWKSINNRLFNHSNRVSSYSFPIPLNARTKGKVGKLRSGRMIYEFIEMAENDLASVAYRFKFLVKADVKNYYPSVYTHSIPWALHGKRKIRKSTNRHNYNFFGNRLDILMQNSNDGCTNGIPIGPGVSDVISEIVLAAVDTHFSRSVRDEVVAVRFKDDYRILVNSEEQARHVIKCLQTSLREFRLQLNEEKTTIHKLPDGLFRPWVSKYHSVNARPKSFYSFKKFKEVYLAVVAIDKENPGTGVIDRFLADLVTRRYRLRVQLNKRSLPKVISLLLILGELRTKAFPKVLAIIEAILRTPLGTSLAATITQHIERYMAELHKRESENTYLLAWLCYFIRANNMQKHLSRSYKFRDPIVRSVFTSRKGLFKKSSDFTLFTGVKSVSRRISLLQHLDVFPPQ